jgi:hypothetical protein
MAPDRSRDGRVSALLRGKSRGRGVFLRGISVAVRQLAHRDAGDHECDTKSSRQRNQNPRAQGRAEFGDRSSLRVQAFLPERAMFAL